MPSLSTWDKIGPKTNTFFSKKIQIWMYASNLVGRKDKRRSWVQDKYFFLRGLSTRKCLTRNRKAPHCFYRTHIQSLPWLSVSPSVTPHFELCWNCWICQSSYMDFSKLLLGFVKVDKCISLSCYIEQTFPFCQSSGISVCILFYLLVINKDK